MRKNIVKVSLVMVAMLLIVAVFYFGYEKIEKNRVQAESSLAEMQGVLESQKSIIDTQQAKIEELQGFKEEQQQANEQLSEQERQSKKEDCEAKLKKAQDNLASTQRRLGEDQSVLKLAEADKCSDCYTQCLKNYSCSKSTCEDDVKKQCKKNHEENIGFRKQDVAGDLNGIKKLEADLQSVKNECSQYIN